MLGASFAQMPTYVKLEAKIVAHAYFTQDQYIEHAVKVTYICICICICMHIHIMHIHICKETGTSSTPLQGDARRLRCTRCVVMIRCPCSRDYILAASYLLPT